MLKIVSFYLPGFLGRILLILAGLSAYAAAAPVYPAVLELNPADFQRVVAISDIHGMFAPFQKLLTNAQLIDAQGNWNGGKTLLLIVGDSIDKGPQSVDVINAIMSLQKSSAAAGGKVVQLLGNHEAEFLADPKNKKAAALLSEFALKHISVSDLTSEQTAYGVFLHSQPVAVKIGVWLFCHAGFYPDMKWANFLSKSRSVLDSRSYSDGFLIGDTSILENRDWYHDPSDRKSQLQIMAREGIWGLVFGHQPNAFGFKGRSAAVDSGQIIKIDNGMPPEAGSNPGTLLLFKDPSQMAKNIFPLIQVIQADGTLRVMTPEEPFSLKD